LLPTAFNKTSGIALIGLVVVVVTILSAGIGMSLWSHKTRLTSAKRMSSSLDKVALVKWVIVGKDCPGTMALNPGACVSGGLVKIARRSAVSGTSYGTSNPLITNSGTTRVGEFFVRATCEGTTQKKFFVDAKAVDSNTWERIFPNEVFVCGP
jgi:hypothetical protein